MSLYESSRLSGKEFIEQNQEKYKKKIDEFRKLEIEETMEIQVGFLSPSQSDDGRLSNSSGKVVEAFFDPKLWKIIILNGNHRYLEQMKSGSPSTIIQVKRVRNFHINY